jgi:hypothetical protein
LLLRLEVFRFRTGRRRIAERAALQDRVDAAVLCDHAALIVARERIGRFGIDDGTQRGLAFANGRSVSRVAAEVLALVRVGREVEQHRRHADVVHVLVAAMADHEGAGGSTRCVILGEHRAVWNVTVGDLDQRMAGIACGLARGLQADRLQDRGIGIDQGHRRIGDVAAWYAGAGQDHRDAGGLLVHGGLAPHAARTEVVAVIRRIEDAGVLQEAGGFRGAQDLAHIVVHEGHQAEIGGDRPPYHGFVEGFVEAHRAAHGVGEGV